jgi:hypothetical protein
MAIGELGQAKLDLINKVYNRLVGFLLDIPCGGGKPILELV